MADQQSIYEASIAKFYIDLIEERLAKAIEEPSWSMNPHWITLGVLKEKYLATHAEVSSETYDQALKRLIDAGAIAVTDVNYTSETGSRITRKGRDLANQAEPALHAVVRGGITRKNDQDLLELASHTHHVIDSLKTIDLDALNPDCRAALAELAAVLQPLTKASWVDRDSRTHDLGWRIQS